jgi:hypothetical protein
MEKMRNALQMWQHIEEFLWLVHTIGLWTHVANNKKISIARTKKDH